MDNSLLEKALQIAVDAHIYQVDKAGAPYIFHPIRVSSRCSTDEERIVALLHDTIEDTEVTAEYLLTEGFSRNIIDAILSVPRNKGESYEDFIKRSKLNPIGRQVKLHDLEDNMDITRLNELTEKDLKRLSKYLKAINILKNNRKRIIKVLLFHSPHSKNSYIQKDSSSSISLMDTLLGSLSIIPCRKSGSLKPSFFFFNKKN